jgi:sodium/bile acid cotransporter 7
VKHWFLILLGVALAAGFLLPEMVNVVAKLPGVRSGLVATVLFLMGLTLSPRAVVSSLRYPGASMIALGLNIIAVPLLAFCFSLLLPPGLGAGLVVAGAVPCTLASASVWTRKGGGNDAISMLVTLVTNLLCFIIAPVTLLWLIGRTAKIDFYQQAASLALLVVLPLVVAQVVRLRRRLARWLDLRKVGISGVAQVGILIMVAIGSAAAVERIAAIPSARGDTQPAWLIATAGAAFSLHTMILIAGWRISGAIGLPRPDRVAVSIAGSQKTLMVGLQIAIDCGVSVLPMIMYHVGQLIIDTVWIDRFVDPDGQSDEPPPSQPPPSEQPLVDD